MPIKVQRATSLDYRLPSTVESIQQGWLTSCQASSIISGILAVVSALLLVILKNPQNFDPALGNSSSSRIALEVLAYASLFLNISACVSCFILLDRLGDVPYHAAQESDTLPSGGKAVMPQIRILTTYGVGALWRWVVWHWIICFLTGVWCIFAQVLTYIWLQESRESQIAITCVCAFSVLPGIAFILAPFFNGLTKCESANTRRRSGPPCDVVQISRLPRDDLESGPRTPHSPHSPPRTPLAPASPATSRRYSSPTSPDRHTKMSLGSTR